MVDRTPKFSIIIAASKNISSHIKELMSVRNEVVFHTYPLRSIVSRSSDPLEANLLLYEDNEKDGEAAGRDIAEIRSKNPHLQIIVVTFTPHYAEAVKYLKLGVSDYLALPQEQGKMYEIMEARIDEWNALRSKKSFHDNRKKNFDFQNIVGSSPQLHSVIARSQKLLGNPNITVLIQGETGTGKELMAKAIHYNSSNSDQPFVEIACSSIPETLLESELFGYEKGAFTDAKNEKVGLFELAGNGTIFLDEIGDISPVIQSKLLNALEEKKIRRLGGVRDIPVHARIITATSKNMQEMVKNGTMRKDLYYRLAVFSLELPPLRDRDGDIPQLADHFLHHFSKENNKSMKGFTPKAIEKLCRERWEGNVRELKHVIERAVLLSSEEVLDENDLEMISRSETLPINGAGQPGGIGSDHSTENAVTISLPITNASFSQVEKELVREVLKQTRGNKKKSSEILKISRPRLDRLINDDPEFFNSITD